MLQINYFWIIRSSLFILGFFKEHWARKIVGFVTSSRWTKSTWKGLKVLLRIESKRRRPWKKKGKEEADHYFQSSLALSILIFFISVNSVSSVSRFSSWNNHCGIKLKAFTKSNQLAWHSCNTTTTIRHTTRWKLFLASTSYVTYVNVLPFGTYILLYR